MFDVVWLEQALDELAALWLRADSATRQAITAAAHALDEDLQIAPEQQGESREAGERVYFSNPLGISFEVDSVRLLVRVLHVWDIRRHR